ncbi:MAG: type II/IV secretion system protein [Gemmatimonadetes bacterium]|nr:type II/IV secretion system protein [Gemmatimonadota bacterium]
MTANQGRDLREAANGPLALRLSPRYLDEHCVLPLGIDPDGALATAVGGPLDLTVSDELTRLFGRRLRLVEMPAGDIQAAILSAQRETVATGDESTADVLAGEGDGDDIGDLHALANQAPVIQLVNVMLREALRSGASDVHVESTVSGLRVRFRLDGVLQEISRLARHYQAAVLSRIKIMAGLNIAERRLPQDGRARLRLGDREIDLRVSTLPALHGESVVLRILDHGATARDLSDLGMSHDAGERFDSLIRRASGILLVTGPTGSGKTTTLYGALARVNRPGVKIVTVEDPVEYQIDGVTQIPANRKAGLTFAGALRSILRHDPDVIMVGEMRDRETAEVAIQAALTGHLVFATLHTSDAPGGVTRLVNMGIEPYLVAATVQGILAQRLVRVVCRSCRGSACEACSRTGYAGRTGIFELMAMTEELRALVVARAPLDDIRAAAQRGGMKGLYQDGMSKVEAGITTVDEVLRVTSADAEP